MKSFLSAVGALGAALAASACCWIPALLGASAIGASGASSFFATYRPWLLGLTALCLLYGFRMAYRRGEECCETPAAGKRRRLNVGFMWVMAAFSVGSALYPTLAVVPAQQPERAITRQASARTVRLKLEGLDCEACMTPIVAKLRAVKGVTAISADYPSRTATVTLSDQTLPDEVLISAVKETGFIAKLSEAR